MEQIKIASLKRLEGEENRFVLGRATLESAAKGLDLTPEDLRELLEQQLLGSPPENQKLATVLEFLIELIGLRFVLYKMGLLLFNLENEFYGNWFLALEIGGEYYLPATEEMRLSLASLSSTHTLFKSQSDRPVVEMLIFLCGTDPLPQLEMLESNTPHNALEGSRISLLKEDAELQVNQIENIKQGFHGEKKRLDQLEKLFEDGFA